MLKLIFLLRTTTTGDEEEEGEGEGGNEREKKANVIRNKLKKALKAANGEVEEGERFKLGRRTVRVGRGEGRGGVSVGVWGGGVLQPNKTSTTRRH